MGEVTSSATLEWMRIAKARRPNWSPAVNVAEGTTKTVWWVLLEMKTVSFVVLRNLTS